MSQYRLPVAPTDHPDVVGHVQRWLAQVEAGRIGGKGGAVAGGVANPSPDRCGCATPSAPPQGEGSFGERAR